MRKLSRVLAKTALIVTILCVAIVCDFIILYWMFILGVWYLL